MPKKEKKKALVTYDFVTVPEIICRALIEIFIKFAYILFTKTCVIFVNKSKKQKINSLLKNISNFENLCQKSSKH